MLIGLLASACSRVYPADEVKLVAHRVGFRSLEEVIWNITCSTYSSSPGSSKAGKGAHMERSVSSRSL
jgi:hypothetical protein